MLEARSIAIGDDRLAARRRITQWRKVAGMAEAFNLPVVSPSHPRDHVHCSSNPERPDMEYMPGRCGCLRNPEDRGWKARGAQKPGLGLKFDQDVIKR